MILNFKKRIRCESKSTNKDQRMKLYLFVGIWRWAINTYEQQFNSGTATCSIVPTTASTSTTDTPSSIIGAFVTAAYTREQRTCVGFCNFCAPFYNIIFDSIHTIGISYCNVQSDSNEERRKYEEVSMESKQRLKPSPQGYFWYEKQ